MFSVDTISFVKSRNISKGLKKDSQTLNIMYLSLDISEIFLD